MKKLIIILLLTTIVAGCSKVWMTAEYRERLESSAIVVEESNNRAQAGDEVAAKEGLALASETLNLLVDALHGRGGE